MKVRDVASVRPANAARKGCLGRQKQNIS